MPEPMFNAVVSNLSNPTLYMFAVVLLQVISAEIVAIKNEHLLKIQEFSQFLGPKLSFHSKKHLR